jgi:hypothetical protein
MDPNNILNPGKIITTKSLVIKNLKWFPIRKILLYNIKN